MKATWPFLTCLIGLAVSGAVLILFVPSLFASDAGGSLAIVGALGGLALLFAAGTRYWRPSAAPNNGR